jgi:predicted N-acyltransferase
MHVAKPSAALEITVAGALSDVDPGEWNALTGRDDPFLEVEFLRALEASGALGEQAGCEPYYLLARRGGALVAAVAFFIKWDSYGEFIFDWSWAEAYQRAGLDYYPKMVVAAPFTPVSGPRLLVAEHEDFDEVAGALVERLLAIARAQNLSSIHFLFVPERERDLLGGHGILPRLTHQFHWLNRGYETFADFLGELRAGKRKQILKERRQLAESGVEVKVFCGADVRDEHIDALWSFYAANVQRHWSQAYLNRATFERLASDFRHRLVAVLARDGARWIGGAFNVTKNSGLYGRYWGCIRHVPNLHFECCYYRLIEHAIAERLRVFEAGAQGEHKFLRGFIARPSHSAHWIAHPRGRAAISRFLDDERTRMRSAIDHYNSLSPVKAVRADPTGI